MKLHRARPEESGELSAFASAIFIEYYTRINGAASATYMAEKFLSEKSICQLMSDGAIFTILCDDDDNYIGFSEYIEENDGSLFLSKLYVTNTERGKGYGRILFDDCLAYAKERNLRRIYLTVNKHNTPSYEMYLHLGFKVIDAVVTDIGGGFVMDDYIMEYRLR